MAIFDQQTSRSGDAATRALSVTTVGTDFVEKVYQNIAQVYDYTYGPTLHPGRLEAIKKMRDPPRHAGPGSRRRHRHQPRALSEGQPRHRHRSVEQDAREGAEAHRREGPRPLRRDRDGRDEAQVRRQFVRRRLRAVRDQRGARPGRGGARDVSRLPSRRPRRHPQSLQEREPDHVEDRDGDLADDGAHRLHGGSRSAGVPRSRPTSRRSRSRRSTSRRSGRSLRSSRTRFYGRSTKVRRPFYGRLFLHLHKYARSAEVTRSQRAASFSNETSASCSK